MLSRDLRRVIAETDVAVAMVTHDLRRALLLADRVAVLVDGRLAQVDRRDAVLDRPATPTVARLVGMANLVRGVVADGCVEVDADHRLPVAETPPVGTSVVAGVHPEDLKIEASEGEPIGKGRVAQVVDDGTAATIDVEWGGARLASAVLAGDGLARSLSPGDVVSLTVRPERVHCMLEEGE